MQRLYQAGRAEGWPAGESLSARLVWAPHTPTDRAAVLDEVVQAYGAGVLSLETAVGKLMDAGYPVKDAAGEVARIREAAVQKQQAAPAAMPGAVSEGHGRGTGGTERNADRGSGTFGFEASAGR